MKQFSSCKFFILALAGGLLLETEWEQVSSGFEDSFQYSDWCQQCCSLNVFDSPTDFQLLQPSVQAYGDRSKFANYN